MRRITMFALAALFGVATSFAQTTAKRDVKLPASMASELPANSVKHQRVDQQRQNGQLTPEAQRQLLGNMRTQQPQMPWHLQAPRRAATDEPISSQPEGDYKVYSRSAQGYVSSWFGILSNPYTGRVAELAFADGGQVYVKNMMAQYAYDTWCVGQISGQKISFDFPQPIEIEGYTYYLWLLQFDADQSTYVPADGLTTLTLNYDSATGDISTPSTSDFATGMTVLGLTDDSGSWYGYADYNISMSPVYEQPVEAPQELQTEIYQLQAGGFEGTLVNVGFSGNDVYVQGIYPGMPEAWTKGRVDGNTVSFESGQYLGADLAGGYHQYFMAATYEYEYDDYYGDTYYYDLSEDDVVFTLDPDTKEMATTQTFLINAGYDEVSYAATYREATMKPFTEVAATPAAPVWINLYEGGWSYYGYGYGWGYAAFDIKVADVDGNYIIPGKLTYQLYKRVNGEESPLVINWYDYPNVEQPTMTEIPYGYSENWDFYAQGSTHTVYYHAIGAEAIGVQTIYRGLGVERRSDIIWKEMSGIGTEMQPDAAQPEYPEVAAGNVGENINYSPYTGNESRATFGNWTPQTVDVAMLVKDASLEGTHIDQITFPVRKLNGMSGYKVWLSSQLRVEGGQNVPDLVSIDVEPTATGDCTVVLPRPYTLTAEGVYVGYTVTVDDEDYDANGGPVTTIDVVKPSGFYLHTSREFLKWMDVSEALGTSALLTITVSGSKIQKNAAAPEKGDMLYVKTGEAISVPVTFSNHGSEGISSLDVEYTLDGNTKAEHYDLRKALAGQYGLTYNTTVEMPAVSEADTYDLEVKVVKVNGVDNEDTAPVAVTKVAVLNTVPKHRTLLEEYTGTWCGWCPRGFVALELLHEQYPDEFVCVSYHNSDPMEITTNFPSPVAGFPTSWMDRGMEVDPYMGLSDNDAFETLDLLQWRNTQFGYADLDVNAVLSEDEATISVTTNVTFPFNSDEADFALEYILVEDGMTGEGSDWQQSNYYSGTDMGGEDMKFFQEAGDYVEGLLFNDVAVAQSEVGGIDESIPTQVEADVPVVHTYEFYPDMAYNTAWKPLIQDKSKLRVVVLLIDRKTGYVANANKCPVENWQTVGISPAERQQRASHVYDLQGRRITTKAAKGIYVVGGRKVVVK